MATRWAFLHQSWAARFLKMLLSLQGSTVQRTASAWHCMLHIAHYCMQLLATISHRVLCRGQLTVGVCLVLYLLLL